MALQVALLFIITLLNLALAITIYIRSRRNPINIFYNLIVVSVAFWSFCYGMLELSTRPSNVLFWYYLTYVAGSLIASFFFYFSSVFPTKERSLTLLDHFLTWGFPVVSVGLIVTPHVLIREIIPGPSGWSVVLEKPAFWTYSSWLTLLMGRAFIHLFQKYQRASGRPKMQLRYVLFGTAISTSFGSVFNLVLPGLGNTQWIWLGPLFTIVLIGSTAYAIVKHRLMDIRAIFNRAIVYSVFLFVTLAFYTLIVLASQQYFKNITGVVASLLIGSLLVALGLEPLRKLIQKTTDRIFFKGEFVAQQLLGTVTDTLSSIADLEKRLYIVANRLATDFRAERSAFWIFDQNLKRIALNVSEGPPIPSENFSQETLLHYFTTSSIGEYVRISQQEEPLVYDELQSLLSGSPEPQAQLATLVEEMKRLGIALIIPISNKDSLVGLLLMGPKRSGELYFQDDLKLLGIISQEAGIAIDNARLYHRLQQQMEELKWTHSNLSQVARELELYKDQLEERVRQRTEELAKKNVELQNMMEKAQESDRLKTRFLANMSHELRTPLNAIIGFAQVILEGIDGELTDVQRNDMTAIHQSGVHLLDMINDILDVAKIEAGQMALDLEEAQIQDVIQSVISSANGLIKGKQIELKSEMEANLPRIRVDRTRLRQIILNLVSNAAKFTTRGRIVVKAVQESAMIRVSVTDTGIGIRQEDLPKLFKEFRQLDASTTRNQGGTGLGLTIAKRFVELHGGRIWVESQFGIGTTFSFNLPLPTAAPLRR